MKWIKKLTVMLMGVCLLCGCTKSNIISGDQNYGDLPQPSADGIVWEQLWEDFQEDFTDEDLYPFVETVNAGVYPEENKIKFFLLLNTEISAEEAAKFATEVIKGFNDLVAEQNSAYAMSSNESYGGYVSKYGVYVMVAPDESKGDKSCWILEDTIPAGEYREVDPAAAPKTE